MLETLPDPATTAPVRCPHFGPCGGCTSLDVPYGEELRAKQDKLKTALGRHPELARAPVLPILGAHEPLLYRTSIKVPFGWSKSGPVAGFFERRTHHIVDLTTCLIQHPKLTELVLVAKQLVSELKIAIHDERTGRGILRHLVARVGEGTGEVLAGLVVQKQGYGKIRGLALGLLERLGGMGLVGVVQNIHDSDEDHAVLGDKTLPLAGRTWLNEVSDGLKMRTSLSSFTQVNAAQAQLLYREVLRMLDLSSHAQDLPDLTGKRIVDLYCGVGPISLRLARAGAQVDGVEWSRDSVKSAIWASRANGLTARARFHAGDAAQGLRNLAGLRQDDAAPAEAAEAPEATEATEAAEAAPAATTAVEAAEPEAAAVEAPEVAPAEERGVPPLDAIIVDPPRRGLAPKVIEAIVASGAKQLVYVACDPFTFANDLVALSTSFEIAAVRPVDLFPRTLHLEAVALLRRR